VARTLLTIADLFNYWLSGSRTCEFTEVTTLQCYNPRTKNWDFETLKALGLAAEMFPPVVMPGTKIGDYQNIPVITPACHDTGSAVVAVPSTNRNSAYLSSGTWSLIGMELDHPLINDEVYEANITNEGGVEGTYRLLKNVAGLWLVQQSMQTWASQGKTFGYDQLNEMAQQATPFISFIEPDDPLFLPVGDIPSRIREFCARTRQPLPQDEGQIMRTIYQSLAMKYRFVLEKLARLTGRSIERLHIIGGGSQNVLLSQMTADAIGREVIAGPVEATALGNAIVQMITLGEFSNMAQAREEVQRSFDLKIYMPQHTAAWDEAYERFKQVVVV
jgi:rhamnulokinase